MPSGGTRSQKTEAGSQKGVAARGRALRVGLRLSGFWFLTSDFWRKDPVPSGAAAADRRDEGAEAVDAGAGLAAQGDGLGRIEAMSAAGGGAAGAAGGRARAGAEAAVHPAAAVPHRRLAAAAAGPGAGAAARGGEEVARGGAVPQPAATVHGRRRGGGLSGGRNQRLQPMPSGGKEREISSHWSSPKLMIQ
jgi:hypothetical protein